MSNTQQQHEDFLKNATLSTFFAEANNQRVRELQVGAGVFRFSKGTAAFVELLVAAHVGSTSARKRAAAQLKMTTDNAVYLAEKLIEAALRCDDIEWIEKQKETPMTDDIVIRDANGVVQLPNHRFVDLAYAACPVGGSMTFAPRTYGVSTPSAGRIGVGKRCKFIGTSQSRSTRMVGGVPIGGGGLLSRTTFEWMPPGEDMEQFFVRNGAGIGTIVNNAVPLDGGVVFENIYFKIPREPTGGTGTLSQRQDKAASPLMLQSGDVGTKTRVDIRGCEFANAGSAFGMETPQPNQVPASLDVHVSDCYVHDMYDMRNADGSKPVFGVAPNQKQYHSHGYFKSGGTLTIANVLFERIGYIEGSSIYYEVKFNQGAYEVGGITNAAYITWSKISHCGLQVRGSTYTGANLTFEHCPSAMQLGHEQNATDLEVPGVGVANINGAVIRKPRKFVEAGTGNFTLGNGIWLNYVESVTLNDIVIDGDGGTFGGWPAINFSVLNQAFVNIDGVQVRNWPEGLYFHVPIDGGDSGSAAECNVANLTVQNCTVPWRVGWPNSRQAAQAAIGGNWADCNIPGGFDPVALLP